MHPLLFAKAMSTIANMSKANYVYTIAYPEYGGYRVEHDPTFTAYMAIAPSATRQPDQPSSGGGGIIVIILLAIIIIVISVAVIMLRRKPKQPPPPP